MGIVKDATETTARLELLAGCKIITIEKSKIDPIAPDGNYSLSPRALACSAVYTCAPVQM